MQYGLFQSSFTLINKKITVKWDGYILNNNGVIIQLSVDSSVMKYVQFSYKQLYRRQKFCYSDQVN